MVAVIMLLKLHSSLLFTLRKLELLFARLQLTANNLEQQKQPLETNSVGPTIMII